MGIECRKWHIVIEKTDPGSGEEPWAAHNLTLDAVSTGRDMEDAFDSVVEASVIVLSDCERNGLDPFPSE